ncbi:MAG: oligosaccharide flippase family protein [Gammaproteobacteria bacterium]|nr:oligosaccharide flippase family protein [Gammaproteobacteria bacterium]MBU1775250.1 oligosaccharide flippase family protein [Gammaproteobacteria bacterium]MBU1969728.1 oligosaccharide flippase family protein [Gammaproteobacteria bacterium]
MNQALRFGGNLILTRLLFPEAFGMMAIIQAVAFGAHMLTDVGVGPSIVQNERGNNPVFLNTVWTVQIVRSVLVWVGLCALGWPLAEFYGEPDFVRMFPVVGLAAIIVGFNSTKLYTAQRNLEAVRVTQIEIGSYALGLFFTIFLAWLMQSVWALVWGGVFSAGLKMVASHIALHGIKNGFAWDRDTISHMRGFGRWILLSSSLTFLSIEGARLLIGALLDMRQLALFTLASTLSMMFWQAMQQLAGSVFFPAYSEVNRTNPRNLKSVLFKARLTLILPSWSLAVAFTFFGSQIMEILYDVRYHQSGIMLEQLAAGSLVACVWGSYSGVLLALAKVAPMTALTAIQIVCQFAMMFIGYQYGGSAGLVMGVAAANWIVYPAYAFVMHQNGLWQPKLDLIVIAASVLIVVLAWPSLNAVG